MMYLHPELNTEDVSEGSSRAMDGLSRTKCLWLDEENFKTYTLPEDDCETLTNVASDGNRIRSYNARSDY